MQINIDLYVDGSFNEYKINNKIKHVIGWGSVILIDDIIESIGTGYNINPVITQHRNVGGELLSVILSMDHIITTYKPDINDVHVNICYDYLGIEYWATESWKSNKDFTKSYKSLMKEMSTLMNISFTKIKAHTENRYNDLADSLAKNGVLTYMNLKPISDNDIKMDDHIFVKYDPNNKK